MDYVYVLEGKTFFSPDETELWLTVETNDRFGSSHRIRGQHSIRSEERRRKDFGTDAVKLIEEEKVQAGGVGISDMSKLLAFSRSGWCKILLVLVVSLLQGVKVSQLKNIDHLSWEHVLPISSGRVARSWCGGRIEQGHYHSLRFDRF